MGQKFTDDTRIEEEKVTFFRSLYQKGPRVCWGLEGLNWSLEKYAKLLGSRD